MGYPRDREASRLAELIRRAALILGGSFLSLALLEVGIRLILPEHDWKYRDASMDWRIDRRLGWATKPWLDVTTASERGWLVRYRTNGDGVTPATTRREKSPGTTRIMIFGDSIVVGRAVPPDRTVNADLERLLRQSGYAVEVINAGVEGYSTDQVLLRIQQLATRYHPDLIAYGLCDNDFGGNEAKEMFGLPKPRFFLDPAGGLVYVPPAGTARRIESFGSGPAKWVQYSAFYRLLRARLMVLRARLGGWESRNLIGLASDIYYSPRQMESIDWRLFTALLVAMDATAKSGGAGFFFYSHPALAEVWDPYIRDTEKRLGLKPGQYDRHALERRLAAVAAAYSVRYCPLVDSFLANWRRGPFHLLPRDPHCNPTGYQVTAEAIARFLKTSGLLSRPAPTAGRVST